MFVLQPTPIGFDPITTGPLVLANRSEVSPGSRLRLTIDGFESKSVTMTTCGNEARRGSGDCDLASSVSNEFNAPNEPMVFDYPVGVPPSDCPCVIRVVGRDVDEIAVTPIVLTGHPVGPIIDPPTIGELVKVLLAARPGSMSALGSLRAQLGGPVLYEVTVVVRNISTVPLKQITISGSAGRDSGDNLSNLEFDDPDLIGVGQTWTQTIVARVPSPSFGDVEWRVTASGSGPSVTTVITTDHRPWLLIVLVLVAASNVFVLVIRWATRRHTRKSKDGDTETPTDDSVEPSFVSTPA